MADFVCNTAAEFQTALNNSVGGDTITLTAGNVFNAIGQPNDTFTFPTKASQVIVRSSAHASMPARRITPGDASLMPTLHSASGIEPVCTLSNAANWKLDGLRFTVANTSVRYNVILCLAGGNQIYCDRLLFQNGNNNPIRRFIALNGTNITVTRCHGDNIRDSIDNGDTQGFLAYDGAGPYLIHDNYFEATGENIMFGGSNPSTINDIPNNVTITDNHCFKRLQWLTDGVNGVKNLLEIKCAKNVTIRGNTLENNWDGHGQDGTAVLFTPRPEPFPAAPFSVLEDILFEENTILNAVNGITITGFDDQRASEQTKRITIQNNLIVCSQTVLSMGGEVDTVTFSHNTCINGGKFMLLSRGAVWPNSEELGAARPATYAVKNFTISNNLANHNLYGIFGDGGYIGTQGLIEFVQNSTYTWTKNVLAGGDGGSYAYPAITLKPSQAVHNAEFTNYTGTGAGDYTLITLSTYQNAGSDGLDLGRLWDDESEPPPSTRTRVRHTNLGTGTGGTVASVTISPAPTVGDVVIFVVNTNDADNAVTHSDANGGLLSKDLDEFRNTTTGHTFTLWSRRYQAGNPTTYNFNLSVDNRWTVLAIVIADPHATSIYDVAPDVLNALAGGTGTLQIPAITTLTDNALACAVLGTDEINNTTATTPSGWTVNANGGEKLTVFVSKRMASPGSTGTADFTTTLSATKSGIQFALIDWEESAPPPAPTQEDTLAFTLAIRRTITLSLER